jgi:hypothetical protein
MKILFLLRTGVIEWTVPEAAVPTFVFTHIASKIRLDGYFMSETLYLRHDELIGISVADGQVGPVFKGKLDS